MSLFDADRRKSWQRLTLSLLTIGCATVLVATYYISDVVWGQVTVAALGAFVGSETVRHYARIKSRADAREPVSPEPYGPEEVV